MIPKDTRLESYLSRRILYYNLGHSECCVGFEVRFPLSVVAYLQPASWLRSAICTASLCVAVRPMRPLAGCRWMEEGSKPLKYRSPPFLASLGNLAPDPRATPLLQQIARGQRAAAPSLAPHGRLRPGTVAARRSSDFASTSWVSKSWVQISSYLLSCQVSKNVNIRKYVRSLPEVTFHVTPTPAV